MSEKKKPGRKKKKIGRPYKLTYADHVDMIRRKRAGEDAHVLATLYGVQLHTVYRYLNMDPAKRHDAPKGATPA